MEGMIRNVKALMPITNVKTKEGAVTEMKRSEIGKGDESAYRRLRESSGEGDGSGDISRARSQLAARA